MAHKSKIKVHTTDEYIATNAARSICAYWKRYISLSPNTTGADFSNWLTSVPGSYNLILASFANETLSFSNSDIYCPNCGVYYIIWGPGTLNFCTVKCAKEYHSFQ